MTAKQFMFPELDDLMKWHLYIGSCPEDKQRVCSLYELVHTLKLTYSLSSFDAVESSVKESIEEGINFSQRCLLYVSPAYINNCWSPYELQEAEKKVKYFGKKAVVAVIEPPVDQCHLQRFSEFTQIKLEKDQPITEALLKEFLSEFELKPTLSTIPKSNIGVGVAYTYFYGFLQLQLPGFFQGLKKVCEQENVNWNCVVKKMLIIIPKSVNSPPKLRESGSMEQTNLTVPKFACRSGRAMREYTVPVYKLTPVDCQDAYYMLFDKPSCLYALHEAHDKGSAGLSKSELYQARNEFCFTLKGLLNHPHNLATYSNKFEMLVWPDSEGKELSEFLYQQIKDKQLTEGVPVQIDDSVQAAADTGTYLHQKGIQHSTVYRDMEKYQLKHNPRGCCVIINNSTFSNPRLEKRTGAEAENDRLKELFTQLHFKVDLHENKSAAEMKTCLESYQGLDHSMHDAFVCCILSHGVYGSVYGTDGNLVTILSLMELFYDDACSSLQGKPKLFFIGACQTEESRSSGVQNTGGTGGLIANADPDYVAQPTRNLVPSSHDFIVSFATLPKTAAYAHPDDGGLYVQALCKNLKEDYEIDVALRKVCSEVNKLVKHYSEKDAVVYTQKPFYIRSTWKSLFLCAEE